MFEDLKYDPVRDWIKDRRKESVSWEDIIVGEGELESLLHFNERFNHWPHLTKEDWECIVNQQLKSEEETLAIKKQQESATIHDNFQENAVTDIPRGKDTSWQTYKRKLLQKGFKPNSVDEIETATFKLIKRLSLNTTEIGARKGLVIGNVQSGKTANMAALMAMAADWGWNMFIVLSGTIENLRKQTQTRLVGDLFDPTCKLQWISLDQLKANMPYGARAEHMNFNSSSRYITVILKNATRLRNLIKWLQEDSNSQKQMKILVIDDEADQAGINTANLNSNERKTISKLICALVNGKNYENKPCDQQYMAMNYIAYTATPYANILNEHGDESIYPKNFISSLSVSTEYFGPQQIFGCEDTDYDGLNIIRTIKDEELTEIQEIHSGDIEITPNALRDAICWFLCCVACQRYNGYKKPVSMLVHTSQKTDHHDKIAKVIYNWIANTDDNQIISYCKKVWNKETKEFDKKILRSQYLDYGRDDDEILDYPSFEQIKKHLKILLSGTRISNIPLDQEEIPKYHDGIHLCIDNCQNNGTTDGMVVRLLYPSDEQDLARAFIVVGGQTLSRGLTIEGLVSTYFLRAIKQADTLMQMGRWFGYRKGYETLPRIWMTNRIKQQFEFLAELDKKLRDELKRMDDLGIIPERYGPRVIAHPQTSFIRITAKNRMQEATNVDYSGVTTQTTIFDNDKVLLGVNLNATREFLSSLFEPAERKSCNEHSANTYVWRNVKFNKIKEYLEKFHYSPRQTAFNNIERMMLWFEHLTSKKVFTDWSVILAGADTSSKNRWELNSSIGVSKVCRTKKKNLPSETISIGTLRSPKDMLADIDLENASDELKELVQNFESKNTIDIRNKAGLGQTPQLIIYVIDKDSKAREGSTTREDLNAADDIVGISITVPEDPSRSGRNVLAIPIDDKLFDFIEDLDETDAN